MEGEEERRDGVPALPPSSLERPFSPPQSHAGKVVLRSWYEKNKHIFPASRWEPYDPEKKWDKYTVSGTGPGRLGGGRAVRAIRGWKAKAFRPLLRSTSLFCALVLTPDPVNVAAPPTPSAPFPGPPDSGRCPPLSRP